MSTRSPQSPRLRQTYHFYNLVVLLGLALNLVVVLFLQFANIPVDRMAAIWWSRPLFACIFVACMFVARYPECSAKYEAAQLQPDWERKSLAKRTPLWPLLIAWLPAGILIQGFEQALQSNLTLAIGIALAVCFFWGYIIYHRSLIEGTTGEPALGYWTAISFINWICLVASILNKGWLDTSTILLMCWSAGSLSVLLKIAFTSPKKLRLQLSRQDTICLLLAGCGLATWLVSGAPDLGLIALLAAMTAAVWPLVTNAWAGKENPWSLAPFALGACAAICTVRDWSNWQNWAIPMIGALSFGGAFVLAQMRRPQEP